MERSLTEFTSEPTVEPSIALFRLQKKFIDIIPCLSKMNFLSKKILFFTINIYSLVANPFKIERAREEEQLEGTAEYARGRSSIICGQLAGT